MEEELSCPFCLDLFVKPFILNCSHNFCEECCKQLLLSSSSSSSSHSNPILTCPLCGVKTPKSDLKINRALCNLVEIVKKSTETSSPLNAPSFSPSTTQNQNATEPTKILHENNKQNVDMKISRNDKKEKSKLSAEEVYKVLVTFPRKYQKFLLEDDCKNLKEIEEQAKVTVKFPMLSDIPSAEASKNLENRIVLKGTVENIAHAQVIIKRYIGEAKEKEKLCGSSHKIKVSLFIPKDVHPYLFHDNAKQLKIFEEASNTRIMIPSKGNSTLSNVIIEGLSHESVALAEELLKDFSEEIIERLKEEKRVKEQQKSNMMKSIQEEIMMEEMSKSSTHDDSCLIM